MFELAHVLHSQGFSISIIHTQFNAPNPANHADFSFHPIPDGLSEAEASMADLMPLFTSLNGKCAAPFRDRLSQMLVDAAASDQEEPIACLISDAFWYFSQDVADGLGLPRFVLRTGNVSSFVVLAALPLLRQKGYFPIQESQLESPVPEFPPLKVKDIPKVRTSDPELLFTFVTRMRAATKASRGLIFNTFQELEEPAIEKLRREFGIPVFPVGPFHKSVPPSSTSLLPPDGTCISWLNTQPPKSVLYVSFGSLAAISESDFSEIAWGLADSNRPFLWVIRPGLVRGSKGVHPLPEGLGGTVAGRAHIVDWAPQLDVLAHPATGGFWTHNGWNSTLESICEGVPMICLPCFADQMVNARYVSDVWKVGIQLENGIGRGEVATAVRRLMAEEGGEEMRTRIEYLKEKAILCLKQGGSSYKSLQSLTSHMLSF
ncbi:hypothetical protein Nepgr_020920 [Nepenthes gracilis]|uniref:Uncharacterized protein n=1 Tax=Nepenthes gracilis TaxID=150966 RepID=A0AAD3XWK2_NEPGR|nr:hypothetical protein Nepgr_020920 [Nepenthes gracilis]